MPRRIVASALISVAVVAGLFVLGSSLVRPVMLRATVANQLQAVDLDACAADPAAWGWGSGGLTVFAYDRAGRSANPAAPTLEGDLLAQARQGEAAFGAPTDDLTVAVVPMAADGPCALVRTSSANAARILRPHLAGVLAASTIAGMLLAAFGTLWLVVWPLRARIAALAVAARGVGGEGFQPRPPDPGPLGQLAEILSRSHQRIVETRQALEDRNRALEDHLAGIAHDLRTPLASMQLALELLAAETADDLRHEARRALADGVYLSALVENLHQATRLRHAIDVTAGETDLGDVVRRLERRFAIVGRHADIAVAAHAPDGPVPVACTPALAERALANVVQNAIEHNPGPGHVAIVLTVSGGDRFCLTVSDDGPGLPAHTRASLDRATFLDEDARTRGPGLGMLITGEITRRAGWSIAYTERAPTGVQVQIEGTLRRAAEPG